MYTHQNLEKSGDTIKTGFIGAGKVGCTMGKLLKESGIEISGYYSKTSSSAIAAAEFTGSKVYENIERLIEESDAVFLTVPDGKIKEVYEEISNYDIKGKIICHCSGSMTAAECFPNIEKKGAYGYSIHPLFPVSDRFTTYMELTGAFFCIEGDKKYIDFWSKIFTKCGIKVHILKGEDKIKYHTACAISSNLVCALVNESLTLLEECGFNEELAIEALKPLAESNMNHLMKEGPKEALTGPAERCDIATVNKHLNILNGDEKELYRFATLRLTEIAKRKHPERDYTPLISLLIKTKS